MKSLFPAPLESGFSFQIHVCRAFAFPGGHLPRARRPASFRAISASNNVSLSSSNLEWYRCTISSIGSRDLGDQFALLIILSIVVFEFSEPVLHGLVYSAFLIKLVQRLLHFYEVILRMCEKSVGQSTEPADVCECVTAVGESSMLPVAFEIVIHCD
jgi:hypothetical protein